MRSTAAWIILAAAALSAWNDFSAWRFAFSGAVDGESARLFLRFALIPAALAGVVLAILWLAGRGISSIVGGPSPDGAVDEICAACLGVGGASLCLLGAGLAGFYNAAGFAACAAVVLVFAARGSRNIFKRKRADFSRDGWTIPAGAALAVFVWHSWARAAAPAIEWDVIAYHLAIAKIYLGAGAIREIPWLLHSHWPHAAELFYGPALLADNDAAAAFFHLGLCALWLALAGACAKRWTGGRAILVAALIAAQPVVMRFAGTAHSDGLWCLAHLAACAALWRWRESDDERWLWIGGILAGVAASAKLTGLLPLPIWAWWVWRRKGVRAAAVFCAATAGACLPWFIKTFAFTGNPVWPFMGGIFGGRFGGPSIAGPYKASNVWTSWEQFRENFSFQPQWLLIPTAIAAGFAALKKEKWPPFLKFLWLPAPIFLFVFARNPQLWRTLIPFFPAFALTLEWGARRRPLGILLIACALAPACFATQNNELFALLGLKSRAAPTADRRDLFLFQSAPGVEALRAASRLSAPGDKILLFREIRGYYVDADYMWGDPLLQRVIDYRSIADSDALLKRLREVGVTHILINENLGIYSAQGRVYDARTLDLMRGVVSRGQEIFRRDGVRLYKL